MKKYITMKEFTQEEFIEKKSRFIGSIAPVTSEEEAIAFVAEIKAKYKDANHNCYAYVLRNGQLMRFSDDGEPQGTAGKPILEVLLKEALTDVAVVVTRYFGGVLLGAGGLVRAYTQGAKCGIDSGEIIVMYESVRVELDIPYDFYGKVNYIIPDYGIVIENTAFEEGIRMILRIKKDMIEPFTQQLKELSSGVVQPLIIEELWANFKE